MADVLNPDALHHGLDQLDGWTGTQQGLDKSYAFASEAQANSFVERVMAIADKLNHHPDVEMRGYTVNLHIVSHEAGGVTQECLDLATAIDTGEAHGDANPDNPIAGTTG